ncbi:Uncharacterized conserved protein [Phaffia rhodozyma]|uniref:Uncharacterized conserved protein n=1 Tax=Phaffia rhodozyma TaxID=264483 RepID=A0A0F7SEW1_PHARH|nr:Uncharacterized conserved protein [Phaffia rhodozyma]
MGHSHRPTLKQQNKPFKSGHASKSSLKEASKGRLPGKSTKQSSTSHLSTTQTKQDRRNTTKQLQLKKRAAIVQDGRIFAGRAGVPRIVCVVELGEDTNGKRFAKDLCEVLEEDFKEDEAGVVNIKAPRFKTSLQFLFPLAGDFYATLDSAKAADYVVLLLSDEEDVSEWGETLLRSFQSQGVPEIVAVCQSPNPTTPPTAPPSATLKSLLSFSTYFFPSLQKVYHTTTPSDASVTLRALCEGIPKDVSWRNGRGWLVNESTELGWTPSTNGEGEGAEQGTLVVRGYLRGGKWSADRLVHIPNFGDFMVEKIISAPLPSTHARASSSSMSTDPEAPSVLSKPDPETADDLTELNDPDFMANEQTWPTEDDMPAPVSGENGERGLMLPPALPGTTPKTVKRVPKGTSAYQAAWIEEGDEQEGDDSDDDDDDDDDMEIDGGSEGEDIQGGGLDGLDGEEGVDVEVESRMGGTSVAFRELDEDEEEAQLKSYRASRAVEDRNDQAFPDEIDTPMHIPASTRFQRYRGLRSFRTSPWDPYENLPVDYAKIFGFKDYERTGKRVIKEGKEVGVEVGSHVEVHIKDVPKAVFDAHRSSVPFILFSLLEHEHKQSVLHFVVQRNTEYDEPVRAKDPLILCVGPRRYRINPIYSQHVRGGGKGANNVHKSERFLRAGTAMVATTYGPIVFGKQPCLLLRETDDSQAPILVASGSFMNADTTRIIAKRIILTGHPVKIHKKTATIRYMFFNPDDVAYFKPIQMHTKMGRTGHITESLGTHGYYKAHFDAILNPQDTVCMSLYKRTYPKWSETFKVGPSAALSEMDDDDEMVEE